MMMMRNDDKSSTCFSCEYFSFYPNKRRREKKFTALSSSRCHWCLLNFISFFKDVSLWHTHIHTLYRLSTQCGLIQLHDNLVAWKTDHLDCLFPRGFFSICVWKWRVKSLVQNKRKEERPPHPILLSLGVSILACGRANFKKPKRKKKRWWWSSSSSSFHTQNPYGGNYRRRVGPQRLLCSGRPSESSSSAAAAPPVSCFCRDRNLIRLALWTTCAIRRRTRRGESTCCEDQERDSIYRPLYYIRGLLD